MQVGNQVMKPALTAFLQLELFVDDALERFERLRAAERSAVDEERRRTVDAGVLARTNVLIDASLGAAAVQAGVELRGIQADFDGVLFEVAILQTALVGE